MKQLIIVVACSVLCVTGAAAQGSEQKETLRGLHGVHVEVDKLRPEVERDGLTSRQIQVDVELRLRKAGIVVLDEPNKADGTVVLHVMLHTVKGDGALEGTYAVQISIDLQQVVYLYRMETSPAFPARTWSTSGIALVGKDRLGAGRGYVADYVDRFINDYLAVNPK